MRGGIAGGLLQPQPVTNGAACTLFRLIFQPLDGGVKLLRVVGQLNDGIVIPRLLDKALQLGLAAVILLRRVDVGVVVQDGDVEMGSQPLKRSA